MPKILEDFVGKLEKQGQARSNAYAIATSSLQKNGYLKKGSQAPTGKAPKTASPKPPKIRMNRGRG